MKRILSIICILSILTAAFTFSALAETNILQTDVSQAGEGCVMVGIKGSYIADAAAAVKRINELRKEACDEGVKDPRDKSRKLTPDDYKPISWSSDLEYIARIRAAEASVITGHTRPNGKDCFSLSSPNGVSGWGEVLAWNFSQNMLDGIEQWYEEKYDWINNTGGVTGHYTQMIDPDNLYVGLGTFYSKYGAFPNCTSGEFSFEEKLDSSESKPLKDCIQTIEIQKSLLSSLKLNALNGIEELYPGSKIELEPIYVVNSDFGSSAVTPLESVDWSSSDSSTVSVSNGKVECNKAGKAVITATLSSGDTASVTLNIHKDQQKITVKAKAQKLKSASLKKKTKKIKNAFTVKNAYGKITYTIVKNGTSKQLYSKVSISKNGVISIRKGKYKKATYKLKVRITAAGNQSFSRASKTVAVKIQVK
ncbi:MAG: CAP domain-containing protein [Ruminococcus sp.]|nr:CAP domain-containing protein [Ruminococcus sp.]